MEKNKILSKFNIDIKDYNNELEKILESKLFSYDVKNLLLSMLYKIENAYKDYETVKVEVPSKREYIENLLRIIKEKCLKIFLVKAGTKEAEELEKENILFKVDRKNGEIVCFQNEFVMLTAIFSLEISPSLKDLPYDYVEKPLLELLKIGEIDSSIEVIRDFNGWSWDIDTKEIKDIEYNYVYETMLLANGKNNLNSKKQKKIFELASKIAIRKYMQESNDAEYNKKFEKIKQEKEERLKLFNNKKTFINQITEEKKELTKEIERIDKILNNNELLKKEYYARNEKLANKDKIFSVSYLVGILDKERVSLIEKIDECNKLILPKEFVNQKSKLEEEVKFLEEISTLDYSNALIEVATEFLSQIKEKISKINEENKEKLINLIYKIRYYRYIPISREKYIKDVEELKEKFEEVIKEAIKKAQELKIWDNFSEDTELTYQILQEIFDMKMIYLQNLNIQCKYENKELYVEYYDDTIIESSIKIKADTVKIKKKIKLFI